MNKKLADLFRQKYCLERERDKEVLTVLKDFLWGIVGFFLCNAFFLISRRVLQGSEEVAQKINSNLLWTTFGLCFLIIFIIFFCRQKILFYQKRISKLEWQIIEELAKT